MTVWFDNKTVESPSESDTRLIYKACSDLLKATTAAKRLTATTGSWWATRVETTPSSLGRRFADVLHRVAGEHSRTWTAGTDQSQEDDDPQALRGLFHSSWQTHTEPPIGPSIPTEGNTQHIDFTPWVGRNGQAYVTPPSLATLVIQVTGAGAEDTSHQTLGAFLRPPSLRMSMEAVLTTTRLFSPLFSPLSPPRSGTAHAAGPCGAPPAGGGSRAPQQATPWQWHSRSSSSSRAEVPLEDDEVPVCPTPSPAETDHAPRGGGAWEDQQDGPPPRRWESH